jgi:hypothetical protein
MKLVLTVGTVSSQGSGFRKVDEVRTSAIFTSWRDTPEPTAATRSAGGRAPGSVFKKATIAESIGILSESDASGMKFAAPTKVVAPPPGWLQAL